MAFILAGFLLRVRFCRGSPPFFKERCARPLRRWRFRLQGFILGVLTWLCSVAFSLRMRSHAPPLVIVAERQRAKGLQKGTGRAAARSPLSNSSQGWPSLGTLSSFTLQAWAARLSRIGSSITSTDCSRKIQASRLNSSRPIGTVRTSTIRARRPVILGGSLVRMNCLRLLSHLL